MHKTSKQSKVEKTEFEETLWAARFVNPAIPWYVKDVGMVKSIAGGQSGGTQWTVEAEEVGREGR